MKRLVASIMLLRVPKKDNILIFNKRNTTKLTKVDNLEYHWVISFMVYDAFHRVNVYSILGFHVTSSNF